MSDTIMKVRVHVCIDIDGIDDIDDDLWMQGLLIDLKGDLAGYDWFVDESYVVGGGE